MLPIAEAILNCAKTLGYTKFQQDTINPMAHNRYSMMQHIEFLHVQSISSLCLDSLAT